MTGMSRFLPPHVRRETDGAITRISNASQRRVPEQTPIRLTRIATGAPFLSILAYAHLVGATVRPSSALAVCQALPPCFTMETVSFDVPVMCARVYTWAASLPILCANVTGLPMKSCSAAVHSILLHSIWSVAASHPYSSTPYVIYRSPRRW